MILVGTVKKTSCVLKKQKKREKTKIFSTFFKKGLDILKKRCIIYYVAHNDVQYAGVAELADAHV